MTQKNRAIKAVCNGIGWILAFLAWYMMLVGVCTVLGWHPMQETLTLLVWIIMLYFKVLRLEDKLGD